MPIQLTKSRRGLYTLDEYLTFRGEFKDAADELIPLPEAYEPIVYMKCSNSHQYPVRPESGERVMSYEEFASRDFQTDPFECPNCKVQNIKFKVCLLEDQPRTFNDPNHRFIKLHRERTHWLTESAYYGEAEGMFGIARPFYEDYFESGHTNHNDPFADEEVTLSGPDMTKVFSAGTRISASLREEEAVPKEDVYDQDDVYIIRLKGDDMRALPRVEQQIGKYLISRKNYDFYRAILYIVSQHNVTI